MKKTNYTQLMARATVMLIAIFASSEKQKHQM